MPNRIILLNNKPIIARFIQGKNVYGHNGSFWIQRTAKTAYYFPTLKQFSLELDRELLGTSAEIGMITILGKTFKPVKSSYNLESDESATVKTSFSKTLSFYISRYNSDSSSISSFYKRNIPVLMRLDSVSRLTDITISPNSDGSFETKSVSLAGAKGMWCNGEIIMFEDVISYYNVQFMVRVKQDFMSAYERMVSKGNLKNTICFLILNEVRI